MDHHQKYSIPQLGIWMDLVRFRACPRLFRGLQFLIRNNRRWQFLALGAPVFRYELAKSLMNQFLGFLYSDFLVFYFKLH